MNDAISPQDDSNNHETAVLTPEQLAEARRYGQRKLWVSLADKALDLLVLGVIAVAFAERLDAWLASYIGSASLRVIALFLVVTAIHAVLGFPLSFYSGYVLEHQFDLSRQSPARWLWDG